MKRLTHIPYPFLIAASVFIGLAPFIPEPHVTEKIRMLIQGNLHRPLDIFDLAFHIFPVLLLVLKLLQDAVRRNNADEN